MRWPIPRAETLRQRRAEVAPTGTGRVLQGYWRGTRRVLECSGGRKRVDDRAEQGRRRDGARACVRACVRACAYRGERVRGRGGVQFYGNADPQNKVTNEFAAPVLARCVVLLDGVLYRVRRVYPEGTRAVLYGCIRCTYGGAERTRFRGGLTDARGP